MGPGCAPATSSPHGSTPFLEGGYRREVRDASDQDDTPPLKRDNNVYDVRVGTAIDITGLLFGEVSVGWEYQEFDESELDSETGLVYGVGLTWNPTQLTSLSLEGDGGFEPAMSGRRTSPTGSPCGWITSCCATC